MEIAEDSIPRYIARLKRLDFDWRRMPGQQQQFPFSRIGKEIKASPDARASHQCSWLDACCGLATAPRSIDARYGNGIGRFDGIVNEFTRPGRWHSPSGCDLLRLDEWEAG